MFSLLDNTTKLCPYLFFPTFKKALLCVLSSLLENKTNAPLKWPCGSAPHRQPLPRIYPPISPHSPVLQPPHAPLNVTGKLALLLKDCFSKFASQAANLFVWWVCFLTVAWNSVCLSLFSLVAVDGEPSQVSFRLWGLPPSHIGHVKTSPKQLFTSLLKIFSKI